MKKVKKPNTLNRLILMARKFKGTLFYNNLLKCYVLKLVDSPLPSEFKIIIDFRKTKNPL